MILEFQFQLPCQAKFLGLVLLSKILLSNQIAGFLKAQYFKKELKYEINFFVWVDIYRSNKPAGLGLI